MVLERVRGRGMRAGCWTRLTRRSLRDPRDCVFHSLLTILHPQLLHRSPHCWGSAWALPPGLGESGGIGWGWGGRGRWAAEVWLPPACSAAAAAGVESAAAWASALRHVSPRVGCVPAWVGVCMCVWKPGLTPFR